MGFMTKIKAGALAAAAATAVIASAPASAAVIIPTSAGWALPPGSTGESYIFGATKSVVGGFIDTFTFQVTGLSYATSTAIANFSLNNALDVAITNATLDSQAFSLSGGVWSLTNYILTPSPVTHTITVWGTATDSNGSLPGGTRPKSYSGSLDISAVPEPAAWGMMVAGFGLIGAGMRSRRRSMVLA